MLFQAQTLDNTIVENSDSSFLVDAIYPDNTLVISFGFVAWDKRPEFDFYGRLKKLEQTAGSPINKILVRDCSNTWYQRNIPGLGNSITDVTDHLRKIIAAIAPGRVITIGQSMGGYAAVMFGTLLNVDKIIAFGPLSFLNSKEALTYHDHRWLTVMQAIESNPPSVWHPDLPTLYRQMHSKSELHVFFGTKPDEGASESVNLDVLHAFRYAALPNCHLHPFPASGHAVVQHLIDTRRINGILAKNILGIDLPEEPIPEGWHSWIVENSQRGIPPHEIARILMQHGFTETQARLALESL